MKILLIDDSALSRNLIKRALGDQHAFAEANDGMRGLELYFLERPDVVILDLTMPGMNGLDVLAQIKQMDPRARIVIGTADIQDLTRQKAVELGATGFLTKPFTPENVREAVERASQQAD